MFADAFAGGSEGVGGLVSSFQVAQLLVGVQLFVVSKESCVLADRGNYSLGDLHATLLAVCGSVSGLVGIDEAAVVAGTRMYDAVLFFATEHVFLSGRVHHVHGRPTALTGRGAPALARLPSSDASFVVCAVGV